jgi:hypothetical protein
MARHEDLSVGTLELVGLPKTTTIKVLLKDSSGNALLATGTASAPSAAGYAKGCLYIKTDVATGTRGLYENTGDVTTSVFDLVGDIAAADIGTGAVTNAKLSSNAVTAAKIEANAIVTAGISDASITAGKLGTSCVVAAKVKTSVVTVTTAATSVTSAATTNVAAFVGATVMGVMISDIHNTDAAASCVNEVVAAVSGSTVVVTFTAANSSAITFLVPVILSV